jgi:quinol monooxygenase YgiN
MIGVVARLKAAAGKEAEFEAAALRLQAAVNANEPGCLLYRAFRVHDEPGVYVFMEQYRDQAAVDAHRASDHFRTIGRELAPYLDGAPVITRMTALG